MRWLAFIAGGVLGTIVGAGAMLLAYPFVFAPPVAADVAPVAQADVAAPPSVFRFDDKAPGRDPIHWADGSGSMIRTAQGWVLRLDANFKAGPGPNFWLYLNTRGVGDETAFKADPQRLRLAPLKAFEGAQNFLLPPSLDPRAFHTVTVWCETFGAYIASGVLAHPAQ